MNTTLTLPHLGITANLEGSVLTIQPQYGAEKTNFDIATKKIQTWLATWDEEEGKKEDAEPPAEATMTSLELFQLFCASMAGHILRETFQEVRIFIENGRLVCQPQEKTHGISVGMTSTVDSSHLTYGGYFAGFDQLGTLANAKDSPPTALLPLLIGCGQHLQSEFTSRLNALGVDVNWALRQPIMG